ncbi:MAG: BREX protein BrxB domain-containing protein [Pirellulales bacterium]
MSLLKDRIEHLEDDIRAVPPRISVYHDLPFAILRYEPEEEWELRREARLLGRRLEATGKEVHVIQMSDFLWQAIDESEGMEAVVELERERGYIAAQEQVTTYLTDRDWRPLPKLLLDRLAALNPAKDIVFLTRVAAMSPGIYHISKLFDQVQGRTRVMTVLFFPGSFEGPSGLRFMGLRERESVASFRLKIYG